ncbi:MAG: hypothetical protein CSA09_04030 [Candidatus Contendobacter odensis]|uniref:RND transporter n=1 Tax=Candidatus Contendibacter odensensis TaxID=1400860 RepID=A0A2G6PEI7_9GAMM|nr:MAG: hypothetical protein CSA09_04030 [Candidatus Contendobacter odensis]
MRFRFFVNGYKCLFGIVLVLLLGGCSSYRQGKITAPDVGETWAGGKQAIFSSEAAHVKSKWWEDFNSPGLNTLVERAYSQNLTLRIATLRILQARAMLNAVRSERYPSINSSNSIMRTKPSGNAQMTDKALTSYQMSLDSSWEIDLWGRVKQNITAANAELNNLDAAYQDAALSIGAEVASAYINYVVLQKQIKSVSANIALQKQSLRVAKALFKEGENTALDVQQAQAILASTKALIPNLERSKNQIRNALITLLALPPTEIDKLLPKGNVKLPMLAKTVPIGTPVEVLRRRPDIRQAEWSAVAAAARAQAAHLERYPRISLSGSINLQVTDGVPTLFGGGPGKLFSKDSLGFSFGPSIYIPLFNAKRLENNLLAQDAAFQQSIEAYRLAVFRGLQDVENALTALAQSRARYQHLRKSVKAYNKAYSIAKVLYKEGEGNFQNIIDTQRQLIDQQQTQFAEQGNISLAQISLIRSLGGGWVPEEGERLDEATKPVVKKPSPRLVNVS